ncbi:unnamed protein product [Orchesella dallaii]|uniref:C2H2-type domain-containing protein n=1 Tax=Orchesella dallaii TaxID=48710 RepID=A0ABP1PYF2_9HEXA
MEMQNSNNCPQCGRLYGTSLNREKCLEKCGHVKCWECTYLRGTCILCSRPPPPVVQPPVLVAKDAPLDQNDVPAPTPAVLRNGQAGDSGVVSAARGGKGKGAHSKRKAVRKLFPNNNRPASAAMGKAALDVQRAKPKVGSRAAQTKRKVAKRGVPKGPRRVLRPRAPANATADVPETHGPDDDAVPDRSLRSTPSTSTSTANGASSSGQGPQQGNSTVASTSRKGKKSVSSTGATSGTASHAVDRKAKSAMQKIRTKRRFAKTTKRTKSTEVITCPLCNEKKTKINMRRHIDTHYSVKPFACPHCKRSFSLKHHLKKHLLNVHGMTE